MIFRQLMRNFGGNKLRWLNVCALSSNFRWGWFRWTLPTSLTRTRLTRNYLTWTIIFHLLTEKRNRNKQQQQPLATVLDISEFTQQDGRNKRTAGRRGRQIPCAWRTWQGHYFRVLSWTSLTSTFSGLLQKDLFKRKWNSAYPLNTLMFGEKLLKTKLLSRLSHKVCSLFSSPVLLR